MALVFSLIAALLVPAWSSLALEGKPAHNYARIFKYSREMLTRPEVKGFLKEVFSEELKISPEMQEEFGFPEAVSEMTESQFILLLQNHPELWRSIKQYLEEVPALAKDTATYRKLREKWRAKFHRVLETNGIVESFRLYNDPTTPLMLRTADGSPGYRNLKFYVNHEMYRDGKVTPPSDLKTVWIDFIRKAKKELDINVYDFDLEDVAAEIIARAKAGVKVRVGIDAGIVAERPAAAKVVAMLRRHKNIMVHPVDSVGLNHQKIAARDWSSAVKAAALFSSGNLTQSCIGPEGDLVRFADRPADSIPNANNIVTVESQLLAQTINHELTKTLDPEFRLRGKEYPLGGSYKVAGPGGTSMTIVFSPRGGLGNINNHVIARAIRSTSGPIRLLQFAFSSKQIEHALLDRARLEAERGAALDLKAIGEKPFTLRPWSVLLSMSGYAVENKDDIWRFVEDKDSPWRKALGKRAFERLKRSLKVAPPAYRQHRFLSPDGTVVEYNAKLHHKLMRTGSHLVLGSYNFSEGALDNQEYLLVIEDPRLAELAEAAFDGLDRHTTKTVETSALERNGMSETEIRAYIKTAVALRLKKIEDGIMGRRTMVGRENVSLNVGCEELLVEP